MGNQFKDDKFVHLESDIEKIRKRHRQYISYNNSAAALEICKEILFNSLDECKNPRSPGNKIDIIFDERTGFIDIIDNGRGIPTDLLEEIFTSLNMGSNIDTTDKAGLNMDNLGLNGVGSLATCGLGEHVEITSYRGGTENKWKELIFEEGVKIDEKDGKCQENKHGLHVKFKPSKIMGPKTKIIWHDVHNELLNFQYLNNRANIGMSSIYYDQKGNETKEKYSQKPFKEILYRNDKSKILSQLYLINVEDKNMIEDLSGEKIKRYLSADIAFVYTSDLNPYIDSFSNSNNTVDNGDHLDGAIEALCRYLQTATKKSLGEKEKEKLDIKWDDVKNGLSIVVSLRTNFESLYTGQTKHKIVSEDIRKRIIELTLDELDHYFMKNQSQLKELISIVKTNARARREGDKVRTAVIKNTLTNWSSFKMKNFDPCTNKGKEYKELFIIEGD